MALKVLAELEQEVSSRLAGGGRKTERSAAKGWNWEGLLKEAFKEGKGSKLPPEIEKRGRKEKAKALAKLFRRPASASFAAGRERGKPRCLQVFLNGLEQLEGKRPILLLAPTGKARVRLMDRTKRDDGSVRDAYTIHQFLMRHDWLNPENFALLSGWPAIGRPHGHHRRSLDDPDGFLGVLFRALDLNKLTGLILVGDPNQLPPIGPGRPFVDIIAWLEEEESRNDASWHG